MADSSETGEEKNERLKSRANLLAMLAFAVETRFLSSVLRHNTGHAGRTPRLWGRAAVKLDWPALDSLATFARDALRRIEPPDPRVREGRPCPAGRRAAGEPLRSMARRIEATCRTARQAAGEGCSSTPAAGEAAVTVSRLNHIIIDQNPVYIVNINRLALGAEQFKILCNCAALSGVLPFFVFNPIRKL